MFFQAENKVPIKKLEAPSFDGSLVANQVRDMAQGFLERLPYILVALIVFGVFWLIGSGLNKAVQRSVAGRQRAFSLGLALGRVARSALLFIGAMVALVVAVPNFRPGDLAQLLGIGTVAVGFAFRDILQNFLAGILLLLSEPFRIGDQIVVGAYEGTVEDIQTRATFMRTYDGRRVVIPNSNLFTNSVTVNTAFDRRRLECEITISADNDLDEVEEKLLETVKRVELVLPEPPPSVFVVGLENGVTMRLAWWIEPPRQFDRLQMRDQVLRAVQKALHEYEIARPVSTQQVIIHRDKQALPHPDEAPRVEVEREL